MIITRVSLVRLAVGISLLSVSVGGVCQAQTPPGPIPGSPTPPAPPTNQPAAQASVGDGTPANTTTTTPPISQSGPPLPPGVGSGGKVMSTTTQVTSSGATMVITGTGNADPYMLFDLHATNPTDSTMKFTFFFDTPLVNPFTTSDLLRTQLDIIILQGSIAPTTLAPTTSGTISPTASTVTGPQFIPIFQTFLGNNGDPGWTHQPLLDLGTQVLFSSKLYDSGSQFAVPPNPVTIFGEGDDNGQHKDEGKHNGNDPWSAWVQFDLAPHSNVDVAGNISFPEPGSLICWAGLGLAFVGAHYWRRRRVAA
jgi:hypothetical protein